MHSSRYSHYPIFNGSFPQKDRLAPSQSRTTRGRKTQRLYEHTSRVPPYTSPKTPTSENYGSSSSGDVLQAGRLQCLIGPTTDAKHSHRHRSSLFQEMHVTTLNGNPIRSFQRWLPCNRKSAVNAIKASRLSAGSKCRWKIAKAQNSHPKMPRKAVRWPWDRLAKPATVSRALA